MTTEKKINLLDLNRDSMRELFVSFGEKPFRGDQVMKWIYHFGVDNFDDMSNVNKKLKEKLKAECEIVAPEISVKQVASDGTDDGDGHRGCCVQRIGEWCVLPYP